jgi:hypothetical protein
LNAGNLIEDGRVSVDFLSELVESLSAIFYGISWWKREGLGIEGSLKRSMGSLMNFK